MVIVKAVQTCLSNPAQWDAWTDTGQYLYLRYRWSIGTVDAYASCDPDTWDRIPDGDIACFGQRGWDGEIELSEFCARAGLILAPEASISAS